ncbi:glycosyltransferase WbuB [Nitrosococcus watsonii]|uniref:Glycosyl transferase group 1 n=1 Tax=Nitrosococcus watsoni (strain C-113) TaxID=105559 RepID=D8K6H5_NITWC|nr:glycosyltransferase WbuB [Nitrosococcus watsonii]ADJ28502.1 glycosyl transferase group 1 [Nitrosococcus watsonii C-113]
MRILIYGINFTPELTGTGKYSGEMAAWLAGRGHEVRVVTAPPYYPEWRVKEGYSSWRYRRESFALPVGEGFSGWRCPLWVPHAPSGLTRLLHLATFMLTSTPIMLRYLLWRPHVVLLVAPTLFCAPVAWIVARLGGGAVWLHLQDFELDAAVGLNLLRHGWLRGAARIFEWQWLLAFDRVSSISPRMLSHLGDKGVVETRCVLFPNWVDTQALYPLPGVSAYRAELGIVPETVVALYSGNMGEKQGLELLVEAARRLRSRPEIVFVLAGTGVARARLEAQGKDLPNLRWWPLQPAERLNEWLNLANIHLLPQRADAADLVMPSKLTGMLASGRPVVATARLETQIGQVVAGCGQLVAPGDVDGLAEAIYQLARNPGRRLKLGQQARRYAVEHCDYERVMLDFEKNLGSLLPSP